MPGRCPSCNQVYADETLVFCPNDGATIIKDAPPAAYIPQPGMNAAPPQPPANYPPPPPPQAGYYAPPGGQAPPPGWQQQPPYGQQPPPYGQQPPYPPAYGAPAKSSKMPLIIGLAALVLIGGGVGLYFLLSGDSSSTSSTTTTSNSTTTVSSTPSRSPGSTTTTTPYPTTPSTTSTDRSYTDDEKHRLFQAVGMTKDNALIIEVAQKIGLVNSDGNPNSKFKPFLEEHPDWQKRNPAFLSLYNTPEKAREYVMVNK